MRIISIFILILCIGYTVSAQRKHAVELIYSHTNLGLNRVEENRELHHDGLQESSELVADSVLNIFNENISSKQTINLLGLRIESSIPLDSQQVCVVTYGFGAGAHKANLQHISNGTNVLGYQSQNISAFVNANINFRYRVKNGFYVQPLIEFWYFSGKANSVTDLLYSYDHPSFDEKHDNKYKLSVLKGAINIGYKIRDWNFKAGPAYSFIETTYKIKRAITDLDWNETTEEIIEYKYSNTYPLSFDLACSYNVTPNLSLTVSGNFNKYISTQTFLSFKF